MSVKGLSDFSQDEYTRNRMLDDLQLAAELGKTLLERNKELETSLKQHQNVIEDQAQEIEYLTKQTVALREVNDSRLRIYEQLEVSIQDLERANHRLVLDNSAEKKHIKTLNTTIESLETKCEDLQSTVDELRIQVDVLKRKNRRISDTIPCSSGNKEAIITLRHVDINSKDDTRPASPDSSATSCIKETECVSTSTQDTPAASDCSGYSEISVFESQCYDDFNPSGDEPDSGMEQMSQLMAQLRETRSQLSRDERHISELEEQLRTMVQQNQALENQVIQLHHREDDLNMKSMHEELTTLEEVRQGQMCSRCLRTVDQTGSEVPEDDDTSMLEELMTSSQHRCSFSMDVQETAESQPSPLQQQKASSNIYKDLVQKYEALVEVHRTPSTARSTKGDLQDELAMSGDFNAQSTKDTDEESGHGGSLRTGKPLKTSRKTFSTPTDFSEAETNSSGFVDETSNKFTQTEGRVGSFFCTIADGDDCKFSIYDDASPIDSRFRDRPEYRELFKEIFKVLKKAAENKDEGETLPLLDDHIPVKPTPPRLHPVTPSNDHLPDFLDDDSQSVMSSTMSELSISQNEATTVIENIIEAQNQPIPEPRDTELQQRCSSAISKPVDPVLKPLIRQPLEYLSVEVKKRSTSRRKLKQTEQRSDSPVTHIIGSPKVSYSNRPNSGRKRREIKNLPHESENAAWNGSTLHFWSSNRNASSPTPSQGSGKACFEFKPSSASHDLHKLKTLDLSYAEVLRKSDTNKKREMLMRQRRK